MLLIAIMILTVLRGRQYAVVALQKIMLVCSSFSMCLLLQLQVRLSGTNFLALAELCIRHGPFGWD